MPGPPVFNSGINCAIGKGFSFAGKAQQVRDKERFNVFPVVLFAAHEVGSAVLPGHAGARCGFNFAHHQWYTVYIKDNIKIDFSGRDIVDLLCHYKMVVLYIIKINQIDGDMVAILAKRQGFFCHQPFLEIFISLY